MSRRTPMLLHLISLFVLAIAKDIGGEYLRKRNLLRSGHRVTQAGSETGTRVCYITAIFGDSKYETRLKQIHNQTIQSDWIAFTDLTNLEPNGWDIDRTPYHKLNPSPLDDGTYYNSFSKNSHPFRIAKYYKQAFQNIPRLQKYDVIIWLDATIEIEMDTASEWAVRKIESDKKMIIAFAHEMRRGSLKSEAFVLDTKYHDLNYLGFAQPDQNTIKQYESYIQRGYIDTKVYWDSKRVSANVGVLSNANVRA